jgi:hypothetical protein
LTELHVAVQSARRAALDYAIQAGEVLLAVPPEERAALAAAAGITGRRTRFVYVQVAQHRQAVQHAASIREALKIVSGQLRPGANVPLPFKDRCVISKHDVTGWCVDDDQPG